VQAAGAGTDLPWTGYDDNNGGWTIEGWPPNPNDQPHARYHVASPDYFRALGIPLLRGRYLTPADNATSPRVLIINQAMARRYWPHGNAVGGRIDFGFTDKQITWTTVVGVVGDVKDHPDSAEAEPAYWWPSDQLPWSFNKLSVVLRASGDAAPLANQLKTAVHQLDPGLAVADVRVMRDVAGNSYSTSRFALFLVALFAALALALAATGVYGVISYAVSRRMHEFGMRMALGAGRWDVVRLVLFQGVRLAAIGTAAGLVGGAVLTRFLGSLLYDVKRVDVATFAGVAALAITVATLACYVPARRATSADPMQALRSE
jgi:predicted permease